jgi:glycosyltransferase involved in cell wall biosynthesis
LAKSEQFNSSQPVQVIIPAMNEEQGIAFTITEMKKYLLNPMILVVDGKSTDKTVQVAESLGAKVVMQKGAGKGDALSLGIKHIDAKTAYVIVSDADYTYPAEYIPEMIRIIEQNPKIGMVCGNRFGDKPSFAVMNDVFYFGNKLIATTHTILNGVNLDDPLTGLRVIRADVLREWCPLAKNFDIEIELNTYIGRRGLELAEVPIEYRPRIGEKKLKLKHGIIILKRILSETVR